MVAFKVAWLASVAAYAVSSSPILVLLSIGAFRFRCLSVHAITSFVMEQIYTSIWPCVPGPWYAAMIRRLSGIERRFICTFIGYSTTAFLSEQRLWPCGADSILSAKEGSGFTVGGRPAPAGSFINTLFS